MGVKVVFECGGCNATAEGTENLTFQFLSFGGKSYGFGNAVPCNSVEDVTPKGWLAYDPYTYCTYCPKCTKELGLDEINQSTNDSNRGSTKTL